MHFGIIPAYSFAEVESGDYATGFGALVEELGFESLWPVEHMVMPAEYVSTYPYDPSGRMPIPDAAVPDPFVWLAWVAAVTRRIRLSTAVAILPQHNPVSLAKTVASLDALSGGRVMLGVGLGWLEEEALAVGSDFGSRGARANEYIEAMKALWTEPVASYAGRHVRFERVKCNPRPARAEGVPVHVGGHSEAAARRAGRLAEGFLPLGVDPAGLARLRKVMEEAAREAGRDPAVIEVSCIGPADADVAQAYADAGITRMIVAALESDLEGTRAVMGKFSETAIARFG